MRCRWQREIISESVIERRSGGEISRFSFGRAFMRKVLIEAVNEAVWFLS
jgi:hypothetical protein